MKALKGILFYLLVLITVLSFAQENKKVLFIGNSYLIANNDFMQLVNDVTKSAGDNIIYDGSLVTGFSLQEHAANGGTRGKIFKDNWDYVLLQDNNYRISGTEEDVEKKVAPFVKALNDSIKKNYPCSKTIFLMTWANKEGDNIYCDNNPMRITFDGMHQEIYRNSVKVATDINATVSPVGVVFKYLKEKHPKMEIYFSDERHPSTIGYYALACCIYTTIFEKDPTKIKFNAKLSISDASIIKNAIKTLVYDKLSSWKMGNHDLNAGFEYVKIKKNKIQFTSKNKFYENYFWDFGDGQKSEIANPVHEFKSVKNYNVKLITKNCGKTKTEEQTINM